VITRCTGCGQQFVDGRSGDFWDYVRRSGAFPEACALCGSDLPQWTSVRRGLVSNPKMLTSVRAAHGGEGADRH
jgi:hypothetical protein